MSAEEDAELKNLVAQTLENKGILPKIRAELRANVFLALEENPNTKETLLKNDELSAFVKIPVGSLILNLIREFLEFFELEFTLSVFDPETKYGKEYSGLSKDKMMKELKISECKKKNPLLCEVIERAINSNESKILSEKSIDFSQGDMSGSGDSPLLLPSPIALNSTYVKNKPEVESIPVSPIKGEENKDEDESIKEELISNNFSESDNLGEAKLDLSKNHNLEPVGGNLKENSLNSPVSLPKDPLEIDLLTFTPVKETKSKDKVKGSGTSNSNVSKTIETKEPQKPLSILGDLPPLSTKPDEKGDKMSGIKSIISKWPDLENDDESSPSSKSSKEQINENKLGTILKSDRSEISQKSGKTDSVDDFEEDISDLINGHTPSVSVYPKVDRMMSGSVDEVLQEFTMKKIAQ